MRERYQNLFKEKRDKKEQYCCEGYKNLSEDKMEGWLSEEEIFINGENASALF